MAVGGEVGSDDRFGNPERDNTEYDETVMEITSRASTLHDLARKISAMNITMFGSCGVNRACQGRHSGIRSGPSDHLPHTGSEATPVAQAPWPALRWRTQPPVSHLAVSPTKSVYSQPTNPSALEF